MKTTFRIFLFLLFSGSINSQSQNLTNEGTDFWIAFTEVHKMTEANFEINITSRFETTGKITILGGSGFTQSFKVVPGAVTRIKIPSGDAHNGLSERIVNRSINVVSVHPISIFASTYTAVSQSESTACLPSTSLGTDYMIMSYPHKDVPRFTEEISSESEFVVVCGPKPIQVEIIPTCQTKNFNPAYKPIVVNLLPGDMYQVQSNMQSPSDLTGTRIRATNGTDQFAVYSGHKMTSISPGFGCTSPCPLYEISYPTNSWGYQHILVRTSSQNANMYRVLALSDNCEIFENETLIATINSGQTYEGTLLDQTTFIRTTQKSSVAQFMVSVQCSGQRTGDPSMVILNPIEQMTLDSVTFYVGLYNGVTNHYISIITRTSDTSKMKLNDIPITGFKPIQTAIDYSYSVVKTQVGSHTITSSGEGFLSYAYGNIAGQSYFYSAGMHVNPIPDTTRNYPPTVIFPFSNDDHVLFAEQMTTEHMQSTNDIALTLVNNPDLKININGYTSTPGDSIYNKKLAADRAKTVQMCILEQVKNICINIGKVYDFNENRISVHSFGEDAEFLIEKNDNDILNDDELTREIKQAKNRRVEVKFNAN